MNKFSLRPSWMSLALLLGILCSMPVSSAFGQISEDEEEEPILIKESELNQLLMWHVDGKYEKV